MLRGLIFLRLDFPVVRDGQMSLPCSALAAVSHRDAETGYGKTADTAAEDQLAQQCADDKQYAPKNKESEYDIGGNEESCHRLIEHTNTLLVTSPTLSGHLQRTKERDQMQ